jgi:hypothetical protein
MSLLPWTASPVSLQLFNRPTDHLQGTNRVSSPLDLLNKIIGAVIAYGPKNKTMKARKARKAARRKNVAERRKAAKT